MQAGRRWPLILALGLVIGLLISGAPALAAGAASAPDAESLRALAYTNAIRRAAGLRPFSYDGALGSASGSHAAYLAANEGSGHFETHGMPGYTGATVQDRTDYAGYRGARAGEVIHYLGTAEEAIDGWMETIYHRIPFMDPDFTEMGYGQAGTAERANVLLAGGESPGGVPMVPWPAAGRTGVPTERHGLENPDPLRLYPGTTGPVGYFDSQTTALTPRE